MTAFPKDAVFQWRVVNNEAAKAFLGSHPGGPVHQSEETGSYVCVFSKHTRFPSHLSFMSDGRQVSIAPAGYIIRTSTGRFVPVDQEIYERLTA